MSVHKWDVIVRGATGDDWAAFAGRIRTEVEQRLQDVPIRRLELTLTEAAPPRWTMFRPQPHPIAVVSVWGEGDLGVECFERLSGLTDEVEGYAVEENVVIDAPRDEVVTPVLLSLIARQPGQDMQVFRARWIEEHMPLATTIHPFIWYAGDLVLDALGDRSEAPDGVVFEACPTPRDLLNPVRFFGGVLRCVPNMIRAGRSYSRFLDMPRARSYLATRRVLVRSPDPRSSRSPT